MHFIQDKNKFLGLSPAVLGGMATLTIALFFSCQTNAQSQNQALMDHTHPNITIDLSVISGGGSKQPTNLRSGALPSLFNRNLLRPGNQTPRSMLHVPTVNGAPLVQAKKATKVKTVPKSMLHVPPANPTPALQREKKAKAKTPPRKALAKQTKSLNVDRVKSTRKSPPPAPKIVTPIKAVPIKPSSTAKTPKKLQAPKKQVIAKIIPVPTTKIKQTSPPSAPAFNPVPKVIKKVTPTQPAAVIAKMTQAKQQASLPQIGRAHV